MPEIKDRPITITRLKNEHKTKINERKNYKKEKSH